jgi:hypothetical protein
MEYSGEFGCDPDEKLDFPVFGHIYEKGVGIITTSTAVNLIILNETIDKVLNHSRKFNYDIQYNDVINDILKELNIRTYKVENNGTCNTLFVELNEQEWNQFYLKFEEKVFGG